MKRFFFSTAALSNRLLLLLLQAVSLLGCQDLFSGYGLSLVLPIPRILVILILLAKCLVQGFQRDPIGTKIDAAARIRLFC